MSKVELWNFFNSSISFRLFYDELHVIPNFALITVHEEVVDLVVEVLLLERNEVLLVATRSFHSIFENFISHS